MGAEAIIRIEGIEKTYDLGEVIVRALRGVDLAIEKGEYVAIMGPSGSGKSTMLNILGCLDPPSAGNYFLGSENVAHMNDDQLSAVRGRKLGFVFQAYNLIDQLTVLENIHVPLFYQGKDLLDCREHCERLARLVGLGDRLDHRPKQLSGGQQQRVAIARSLVNDPLVILADEPTGNLDSKTGVEILDLFDELNASGKTLVLVTHDRWLLDRVSTLLLALDGQGHAEWFADYTQWEVAQARQAAAESRPAEPRAATRSRASSNPATRTAKPKGFSFREQQEWGKIEQKILDAEHAVAQCEAAMNDPDVASDAAALHARCEALSAARADVEQRYARWAELDAKRAQFAGASQP